MKRVTLKLSICDRPGIYDAEEEVINQFENGLFERGYDFNRLVSVDGTKIVLRKELIEWYTISEIPEEMEVEEVPSNSSTTYWLGGLSFGSFMIWVGYLVYKAITI